MWGKKLGLEISHFKSGHKEARKRNGRQFSLGGEFSRLNIASLALASMDMTPVVWRPREELEALKHCCKLEQKCNCWMLRHSF